MKKVLFFLLLACSINVYSQSPNDTTFYQYLINLFPDSSYYVYDSTESYEEKMARRMGETWIPRLYPHGDFRIAANTIYDYTTDFNNNSQSAYRTSSTCDANWTCLGPLANPANSTSGGGMGRIHKITFDPAYDGIPLAQGGNQTIYAATSFGGLWRTENDGLQWDHVNTDTQLPFNSVSDVAVSHSNSDHLFLSTGLAHEGIHDDWVPNQGSGNNPIYTVGMYRSLDGGQNWEPLNNGFLINFRDGGTTRRLIINPNNPDQLFVATSEGVYRTNNALATNPQSVSWQRIGELDGLVGEFRGLAFKPGNSSVVYAGGPDIFRSVDGGNTWTSMTTTFPGLDFNNLPNAPGWPNFTVNWINLTVTPGATENLYAHVSGKYSKQRLFIYVFNGSLGQWEYKYEFEDGGDGEVDVHPIWTAIAVSPTDPNKVYFGNTVVRGSKTIDISTSIGKISEYNLFGCHADIQDLVFAPDGSERLFCANDGGVAVKDVNVSGSNWTRLYNGLAVAKIWTFDDSEFDKDASMSGMQDVGVNLTESSSGVLPTWKNMGVVGDGYGAQIDDASRDRMFYKVNAGRGMYNYSSGQRTSEPSLTVYPNDPFGSGVALLPNTFQIINHPQTDKMYWGLTEIFRRDESIINDPTDWTFMSDAGKVRFDKHKRRIYEFAIAESNPDYMYLAFIPSVSDPDVRYFFRTDDGGCNGDPNIDCFDDMTDYVPTSSIGNGDPRGVPTGIAVDPNDPKKIWVSFTGDHHDLRVWSSNDAGEQNTWTDEDPNRVLQHLPVNNIVYQSGSNDRVFVATDAGVYYKEAGADWQKYGCIPNVRVTELKINYCANKLRAATFGRGLWEADLPPVERLVNDKIIDSDITWEIGEERSLKKNLRITSGNTLTIKGDLSMPAKGIIFVERGASLIVDGGTITNFCDEVWGGIEVHGDREVEHPDPQDVLNGNHPDHGFLHIKSGATIENARNAVVLVKDESWGRDLEYTGGIVFAENSTFSNNRRSFEFLKFRPSEHSSSLSDENISYIHDCLFVHGEDTRIPHEDIEFFITMWEVEGLSIIGNTFRNDDPGDFELDYRGKGIASIDASYIATARCTLQGSGNTCNGWADGNLFRDLYRGIKVSNTMMLDATIGINKNVFQGNKEAIILNGVDHNAIVTGNEIDLLQETNTFSSGIYLNGSKGFMVEDNEISGGASSYGAGIYSLVSGPTSNELYRNLIEDADYGIIAPDQNHGLQIKCNTFDQIAWNNIMAFDGYGNASIAEDQGFCQADPSKPDYFSAPAGNVINDGSCIAYSDHILAIYSFGIDYNHHSGSSYTPICFNSDVSANDCLVAHDETASCPQHDNGLNGEDPDSEDGKVDNITYFNDELQNAGGDQDYEFYLQTEVDLGIRELVLYYLANNLEDDAITYLENDNSEYAQGLLVPLYIRQEEYTDAQNMLNNYPQSTEEQQAFVDLYQWIIDIKSTGREYSEMTASEESDIRGVANSGTSYSVNAKSILLLTKGEDIPVTYEFYTGGSGSRFAGTETVRDVNLKVYPNPASGKLSIEYDIPESYGLATLAIYSAMGHLLSESSVQTGEPLTIRYSTEDLPSGMYFFTLASRDKILSYRKIVITH